MDAIFKFFLEENGIELYPKKVTNGYNFIEKYPGGEDIIFRLRNISSDLWTIDIPKGKKWECIPFRGDSIACLKFLKENFPWLLY